MAAPEMLAARAQRANERVMEVIEKYEPERAENIRAYFPSPPNAGTTWEHGLFVAESMQALADIVDKLARESAGVEATEAAERKARELGVDLAEVEGTGEGGRILVSDVESEAKRAS